MFKKMVFSMLAFACVLCAYSGVASAASDTYTKTSPGTLLIAENRPGATIESTRLRIPISILYVPEGAVATKITVKTGRIGTGVGTPGINGINIISDYNLYAPNGTMATKKWANNMIGTVWNGTEVNNSPVIGDWWLSMTGRNTDRTNNALTTHIISSIAFEFNY